MKNPAENTRLHHFRGGLRMQRHKQISCRRPLTRPPLPERLFIALGQGKNDAARQLVAPGDAVAKGQPLTQGSSDFSVPVHAPTSGHIQAIGPHPVSFPPGSQSPALVLVPDGRERWHPLTPLPNWNRADSDELIDHLRAHGLAGMGGAAFPSAAKLRGDWPALHTLIINGAECEPWIACDEMLMKERPEDVLSGALVLARAARARNVVVAVEDHARGIAESLQAHARALGIEEKLSVRMVQTAYPQGGERQLVHTLTGREVPHDGLPQDLGVLVHNVATAAAAHDAVIHGLPLIERIVTVTGPAIKTPRNLLALIGTPFSHLIKAAGGYDKPCTRLVLGGPMMGTPLTSDRIAVDKGSNCLLAFTRDETRPTQPAMPCINCGECVRVCPAGLLPQTLFKLIEAGRYEDSADHHLADCIECGLCASVCPSHIPLVDYYRHGKDELVRRQLDARQAELARRRFEAREKRLEEERRQRLERRRRREERLRKNRSAKNEIEAAIARARQKPKPATPAASPTDQPTRDND